MIVKCIDCEHRLVVKKNKWIATNEVSAELNDGTGIRMRYVICPNCGGIMLQSECLKLVNEREILRRNCYD